MAVWIPFFINELRYFADEIEDHLKIMKPTAKSYLDLVTKLLNKVKHILVFRALVCRPKHVLDMLSHIKKTEEVLTNKNSGSNRSKYIYFSVLLYFGGDLAVHIKHTFDIFSTGIQHGETTSFKISNLFSKKWMARFNVANYNRALRYLYYFFEVWLIIYPRIVWIFETGLIAGLVPVTFMILVKDFENALEPFKSIDNGRLKKTSVLFICRLFDNLKHMSHSINVIWANIFLTWLLNVAAIFGVIIWENKETMAEFIVGRLLSLFSIFFVFYFSGEVFCKVSIFTAYLVI